MPATLPGLLGPKRLDRVEPTRPTSRSNTEEDADAGGDGERQHGRPPRDDRGQWRDRRHQQRAADAESDADQAADDAEQYRLDEELQQDVALPGAQRLAQPDLAGPLPDAHQHDV